jgi:hypothetical protein
MLCVGAIAGASTGQRVWIFLPLAAIGASWQAWTEIADTGLRFPSAIAVLTLLVSTANDSSNISMATYGAAFAGGAIWQGLGQYIAARPSDKPPASLASDLEALIFNLARARQFIATMETLGVAGGAIASGTVDCSLPEKLLPSCVPQAWPFRTGSRRAPSMPR